MTRKRSYLSSAVAILLLCTCAVACKVVKLKDAELADKAGRYADAAAMYNTLYRKTPRKEKEKKSYLAFKAAENYRNMRNFPKALNLFLTALNYDIPDSIVLFHIAQSYHAMGKYKDAEAYYKRFLKVEPKNQWARNGLIGAREHATLKGNPFRYIVSAERKWNSSKSDFAPAFTPSADAVYISSARSKHTQGIHNPVTGENNNALYVTKLDAKGKWTPVDSVPGGINEGGDVATSAFTPDGNTMYYSFVSDNQDVPQTVKIYKAAKSGDGGWGKGTLVPIWSDTLRMAAHPCISGNGKLLYFVSDGGYGGTDLYVIPIERIGIGTPSNLGSDINTQGNEMFPSMWGDSTLFFASDGLPGLGGYDLFTARQDSLGRWNVQHLGAPINSNADDYAIAFSPKPASEHTQEGFFCSTRADRRGYPHLLRFHKDAIILTIDGFVSDREGNAIEGATIRIVSNKDPQNATIVTSRNDGYYKAQLTGDTQYVLLAGHDDYLNQYASLKTDKATENAFYEVDFYLPSRVKAEVFQNIYYDFDKATLRPESIDELNQMVKIMQENPEIKVAISSHADRKGSDAYNLQLSQRRAKAVVDYLIEKGIDAQRLVPKGYGKTQPRTVTESMQKKYPFMAHAKTLDDAFISSCTPQEAEICDQLNRRTEFSVIKEP